TDFWSGKVSSNEIVLTVRANPNFPEPQGAIPALRRLGASVVEDRQAPGAPVVKVDLIGCEITDADLAHLRDLPQLRELLLSDWQVTEAGLVHLKALPCLEQLTLWFDQVTDTGLTRLQGLPQLTVLTLVGTSVTDRDLAAVKALAQLEGLLLNN